VSVRRRSAGARWLSLAIALAAGPAMGAPSARLTYVREPGAEACADVDELRRAVQARLGYDPFFPWAPVAVVAHVRREGGAYRAEVTLVDEQGVSRGRRALSSEGDDCAPLVGALALAISLALDPLSLAGKPAGAQAPPAPAPAPAATAPLTPPPTAPGKNGAGDAAPPAPHPVATGAPSWRGWASLGVLGRYGTTPGLAFGGLVRGKVEHGRLSLGIEATLDAPTSASAPTRGSVRAWVAQATLLGCGRVSIVVGCGFVSGGPLVVSGVDLAVPRATIVAYGAFGPRVGIEWPFGRRFRIEGFVDVAVTLQPRAFQVDRMDVFRQSVAAPSAGAALSAQIF
jgi:hypothetical protein